MVCTATSWVSRRCGSIGLSGMVAAPLTPRYHILANLFINAGSEVATMSSPNGYAPVPG